MYKWSQQYSTTTLQWTFSRVNAHSFCPFSQCWIQQPLFYETYRYVVYYFLCYVCVSYIFALGLTTTPTPRTPTKTTTTKMLKWSYFILSAFIHREFGMRFLIVFMQRYYPLPSRLTTLFWLTGQNPYIYVDCFTMAKQKEIQYLLLFWAFFCFCCSSSACRSEVVGANCTLCNCTPWSAVETRSL